ncbi:MAG: DUF3857 and transglutaminase domain-containing protein [bacterium]|nr:DUF3857 and transglutaminase domain-containing protein [bacterium]
MFFKLLIVPLLLLILSANLFPDRVDDLIKNIPDDKHFRDAAVLDVIRETAVDVKDDYSYSVHIYYIKKILSYKGKKEYSDIKLRYNGEYESLKLGNCFAIDPKGNRIAIPENQIHDMNTRGAIFNPLIKTRETIVNFPQIEPGYFIIMDYTLYNSRKKPVDYVESFRLYQPLLYKKVTITFPTSLSINTIFDEKKISFSKKHVKKSNIYTWEIKNSKPLKREIHTPHLVIAGLPLHYSFYKDWQEHGKIMLSNLINVPVDDSIKKLAAELTANCKSDEEKLLALYTYLAGDFNYLYSVLTQIDFEPRPLIEVIRDKKGSVSDFVALFVAMARSAGVKEIYPALILSPRLKPLEARTKIAIKYFYGGLNVYWNKKLFSLGRNFMPFAFTQYNTDVLLGNESFDMIPFRQPNRFIEKHTYNYEIKESSAEVSVMSMYADHMNMQIRRGFQDFTADKRKLRFSRFLGDKAASVVDGPNFLNFDKLDKDVLLEYKLKYDNFLTNQGNYAYFKILNPKIQLDVSLKNRENAYQIFRRVFIKEDFIINADFQYDLANPIQHKRIEFKIGDRTAYAKINLEKSGDQIVVNREIYVPEGLIPKENYPGFRKFILELKNPVYNMIFLEKK